MTFSLSQFIFAFVFLILWSLVCVLCECMSLTLLLPFFFLSSTHVFLFVWWFYRIGDEWNGSDEIEKMLQRERVKESKRKTWWAKADVLGICLSNNCLCDGIWCYFSFMIWIFIVAHILAAIHLSFSFGLIKWWTFEHTVYRIVTCVCVLMFNLCRCFSFRCLCGEYLHSQNHTASIILDLWFYNNQRASLSALSVCFRTIFNLHCIYINTKLSTRPLFQMCCCFCCCCYCIY